MKIVSTEISCNDLSRPSSISVLNLNLTISKLSVPVSVLKLQLDRVETKTSKN